MAKRAEAAGDSTVAHHFTAFANDETEHHKAFKALPVRKTRKRPTGQSGECCHKYCRLREFTAQGVRAYAIGLGKKASMPPGEAAAFRTARSGK